MIPPKAGDHSPHCKRASGLSNEPLPHGHGECILVVDDEPGIRSVVQRTLERFGYQVILAAHGGEGLERYSAAGGTVALVLTDLSMPEMDGPAMARAIRAIDPGARFLGSSGMITQEEEAHARAAGITHFVAKPYAAAGLLTAIAELLAEGQGGA